MHEMGIVQAALASAEQAAAGRPIAVVRLRVGQLVGVVPECLDFAWTALRADTLAADATLEVDYVAPAFLCPTCDREYTAEGVNYRCPTCGEGPGKRIRGRELEVINLDLKD